MGIDEVRRVFCRRCARRGVIRQPGSYAVEIAYASSYPDFMLERMFENGELTRLDLNWIGRFRQMRGL